MGFWSLNSNYKPKFASFLCRTGCFCFRSSIVQNMGRTDKETENAPAVRIKNTAVNQSSFSREINVTRRLRTSHKSFEITSIISVIYMLRHCKVPATSSFVFSFFLENVPSFLISRQKLWCFKSEKGKHTVVYSNQKPTTAQFQEKCEKTLASQITFTAAELCSSSPIKQLVISWKSHS